MPSCSACKESNVGVEKYADFCAATTPLRGVFGCTLTETELTCQRCPTKKRLREGARSFSLAAAEELAADSITPPPVAFDTYRGEQPIGSERITLNIIFKADVASSLEAIELSIGAIKNEQVGIRVLDSGIGNISEADVKTAAAKGAVIMGFRVQTDAAAAKLAERDSITVKSFDIIYELIEAIRNNLAALLPTQTERTVIGKLRVLAIFKKDARAIILGGRVVSGVVRKGAVVDLVRGEAVTRVGKISNLQQEKVDTSEVGQGVECGMRIDISLFDGEIQEGDTLEFITEEQVKQLL